MTGPAWLLWPLAGRLVGDRDGNSGRRRWEARSLAASGRLPAESALHGSRGAGQNPTVGRTRPGHGPGDQHVRQGLAGVVLVRFDTAAAGGCGW